MGGDKKLEVTEPNEVFLNICNLFHRDLSLFPFRIITLKLLCIVTQLQEKNLVFVYIQKIMLTIYIYFIQVCDIKLSLL